MVVQLASSWQKFAHLAIDEHQQTLLKIASMGDTARTYLAGLENCY